MSYKRMLCMLLSAALIATSATPALAAEEGAGGSDVPADATVYDIGVTIEAEDGIIVGAKKVESGECSGGKFVGENNGGSAIYYVKADKAGIYNMVVTYFQDDTRTMILKVNNGEGETIQFEDTDSWTVPSKTPITIPVELEVGTNKIELAVESGKWGPNVDCFTVAKSAELIAQEKEKEEARGALEGSVKKAAATYSAGNDGKYTPDSWSEFKDSYDPADRLLNPYDPIENPTVPEDPTAKDYDDARGNLVTARGELVPANDNAEGKTLLDILKDALKNLVAFYGAKVDEYTEASWSTFEDAYNPATAVAENDDATIDDVEDCYDPLEDAIAKLVKKDLQDARDAVQAALDKLVQINYTDESWDAAQEDITKALAIKADELETVDACNEALATINACIEKLSPVFGIAGEIGATIRIEGEDGVFAGSAEAGDNEEASGKKHAGSIGSKAGGGTVSFNVKTAKAGMYELTISYITWVNRNFDFKVNGTSNVIEGIGNNNSWTKPAEEPLVTTVYMAKGQNEIVVDGGNGDWAPNLDWFTITFKEEEAEEIVAAKATLSDKITAVEEEGLVEDSYKASSWAAYTEALAAAKSLLTVSTSVDDIQAALEALETAKKGLAAKDPVVETAREALNTVCDEYKKADYSTESWKEFETVLKAAQAVVADENATVESLAKAEEDLAEAAKKLVTKVDEAKENLAEAVNDVKDYKEADYTAESWAKFAEALENAQNPATDATATQLNNLITKLKNAAKALVLKDDGSKPSEEQAIATAKNNLSTAITATEGKKYVATEYTKESWDKYAAALKTAKEVAAKANVTEKELTDALATLSAAEKALTKAEVKVSSIKITGISKQIAAGKKVTLKATVAPSNATDSSVTWKSSNPKYATVKNGVVTTKKAGKNKTVTITATANDGSGKQATYKIKIMQNAVKSIKVKLSGKTIKNNATVKVKAGKKLKFKATVSPTKKVNKTLQWTSSNPKYATVKNGTVTTKKAGKNKTVKITAKATDGSNKKITIKVKLTK